MKSLIEYIQYINEKDDAKEKALGLENKEDKERNLERGEIKFTIWEKPDTKINWVKDNKSYQKIEYVYNNKDKGITIDFLLGYDNKDKSWKLWMGKVGAISYDDDPYCTLKTDKFAEAIVNALDKVEEILKEIKENPDNWVQFYIHR